MRQPFTEAWHNNDPLVLTYAEDIPEKRSGHCDFDFPSSILAVIPFDVVLSHMQRRDVTKRVYNQRCEVRNDQWRMRLLLMGLRSDIADYREE